MLLAEKESGELVPSTVCNKASKYERETVKKGKKYRWIFYKINCSLPKPVAEAGNSYLVIPLDEEDLEKLRRGEKITVTVHSVEL